jgi:rod shape-determining protein MreD
MSRSRKPWLLPVSLLIALLLGLLPLPAALQPFRPYWLALVVSYWVLEEHERIGLGFAFAIGLIADLCFGALLGEQALRLAVMTFILQRFRPQLRFFPLPQQSIAIGGLLLNDMIVATAIDFVFGAPIRSWLWWCAPLIGALLWPPLFVLLDAMRIGRKA